MSQCILWRGGEKMNLKIQSYPFKEKLLKTVSDYLWKDSIKENIFTLENEDSSFIDSLCTDAQSRLQSNEPFVSTKLFIFLNTLFDNAEEIVLWYADYYEDLPCVTEKNEFFKRVEEGIQEPSCEVSLWYKKTI